MTKRLASSSTLIWDFKNETFYFLYDEWNVDRAKQIIKDNPRPIRQLELEPFRQLIGAPGKISRGIHVDWRKVQSGAVNLDDPLLVAYGKRKKLPIDGWHRIAKGLLRGLKTLPFVGLTKEESKQVHKYTGPIRRIRRRRRC